MNQPGLPIRAVSYTPELQRILQIPRRTWTDESAEALADELSAALKLPRGTMSLRPIQAQALFELFTYGGLVGPIRVGGGKTLLSLLAFYILGSRRPLLMLPAKLIEKTKREMRELANHWPIPNFIRFMSTEILGRTQHANDLELYQPDLIVVDEGHKFKNPKAACTKRMNRYMRAHPNTAMVLLSGTIVNRSIKEFAHLLFWCLKMAAPVPLSFSEIKDWSDAIDEKPNAANSCHVGALKMLCSPEERANPDEQQGVRNAYRRRLVETPGVVATAEGFLGCSLVIEPIECDMSPTIEGAFRVLKTQWQTLDGWDISDPLTLWRHARELSEGFYYKWDPRPPDVWLNARRDWFKTCREILGNNQRQLDSVMAVTNAVDKGLYPWAQSYLERWRELEKTFTPNTVAVWLDDSVINLASAWAARAPGIVWCGHSAFAERLANQSKLHYYGKKGLNRMGGYIEAHHPGSSLIASIKSNSEGRNLQAWSRNLIISCPTRGLDWEQLLGRTHRDLQKADEVTFEVLFTSMAQAKAVYQSLRDARFIETQTGQAQKLLYADCLIPSPSEVMQRGGYRWSE